MSMFKNILALRDLITLNVMSQHLRISLETITLDIYPSNLSYKLNQLLYSPYLLSPISNSPSPLVIVGR